MHTEFDPGDKLKQFQQMIDRKAEKECAAIAAELESFRAKELEKFAEDAKNIYEKNLEAELSEIERETAAETAKEKARLREELYQERERLSQEVFAKAGEELAAFAGKKEYKEFLLNRVRSLSGHPLGSAPEIRVRKADLPLSGEIEAAFGKACTVCTDPTISLGGVKAFNTETGYLADLSLDTALAQQEEWFFANCGAQLSL